MAVLVWFAATFFKEGVVADSLQQLFDLPGHASPVLALSKLDSIQKNALEGVKNQRTGAQGGKGIGKRSFLNSGAIGALRRHTKKEWRAGFGWRWKVDRRLDLLFFKSKGSEATVFKRSVGGSHKTPRA